MSWASEGGWIVDGEGQSFLFSLDHSTKHKYKPNSGNTIYNGSSCGPNFGGGNDLLLLYNNNPNDCLTKPGSYELPNDTHLAGSSNFQVSDFEVWKIQ
eukprot:TRINITY_DN7902_c0_g1_i1.p2 TRINITY_DN7902_c0_g1~~TRINITY_DN7902_c0_g1_i1.p2  ORF type:complete len:112 (+),score=28.89 TRINITY_DN7902_c0_g1_i1:45-338(+)